MATRKRIINVCDNCATSASVTRYKVEFDEEASRLRLTFDACAECEERVPLAEWRKSGRAATGGRGRMLASPVISVEEVEALAERHRAAQRGTPQAEN